MKIEIESRDIEAIAQRVSEIIKPLLSGCGKLADKEDIFDVNGLAEYLHVDPSWIYKQISLRAIPFFKTGKYSRFRKKDIDKWIEANAVRPVLSPNAPKMRG